MLFRCILVLFLMKQTAYALKCHVCKNLQIADCLYVNSSNDNRFLQQCPDNSVSCGLEVTHSVDHIKVYRDCVSKAWSCRSGCYLCDTNGCNYGTEIRDVPNSPGVEVSVGELIQANIYSICGILLITALILTFCIVRCCSKEDEYEEEDYEEDEEEDIDEEYDDFEYEETNEKTL